MLNFGISLSLSLADSVHAISNGTDGLGTRNTDLRRDESNGTIRLYERCFWDFSNFLWFFDLYDWSTLRNNEHRFVDSSVDTDKSHQTRLSRSELYISKSTSALCLQENETSMNNFPLGNCLFHFSVASNIFIDSRQASNRKPDLYSSCASTCKRSIWLAEVLVE